MENLMHAAGEYFVITVIGACFVLGMVLKATTTIIPNATRERSRREIAAYIAEGSITPEQGERLMRANISAGTGQEA
jgi:hypothetical protein